jgi:hypothetical protein
MKEQYRLAGLGNHELLRRLSELVRQGNELTAELLAHLAEVQERRLHVDLGFSSLFAYCTEALGFSESAAGRRIAAARLCQRFPQVFELVACGELHLSALSALGPYVNDANATELFDACRRKSRRRVDEILAARFPKPDLPEQIRRLPTPRLVQQQLPAVPTSLTAEVPGPSLAISVATPTPIPHERLTSSPVNPVPVSQPARQKAIEPLSSERFGVRLTIDSEARDLLERARALASHRLPNGDVASLFKLAMRSLVRELEKERFGIGRRPADSSRERTRWEA